MKKCSKCKQLKKYSDYTVAVDKKDGCQSYCKPCKKALDRKYHQNDPEAYRKHKDKWSSLNPDYMKGYRVKKYFPGETWQMALYHYKKLVNSQGNKCHTCNTVGTIDTLFLRSLNQTVVAICKPCGRKQTKEAIAA